MIQWRKMVGCDKIERKHVVSWIGVSIMQKTKEKRKIILLETSLFFLVFLISFYLIKVDIPKYEKDKEESSVSLVDNGIEITDSKISLDQYHTNLWIKHGGTYYLNGTLQKQTLLIDTEETVELIFDNVTFLSKDEPCILNKQKNELTLYLKENTSNMMKTEDSENIILSNGNVIIDGSGKLTIETNQTGMTLNSSNLTILNGEILIEAKNGCKVDGNLTMNQGFLRVIASNTGLNITQELVLNDGTIYSNGGSIEKTNGIYASIIVNGGTLLSLGMDHTILQENSNQPILTYTLEEIAEDEIVSIQKINQELLSFQAKSAFHTIIVSTPEIEDGIYSLYIGGNHFGTSKYGIYSKELYIGGTKIGDFEYKSNIIEN